MKPPILPGQELRGEDGWLQIMFFTTGDENKIWASPRCKSSSASAQKDF